MSFLEGNGNRTFVQDWERYVHDKARIWNLQVAYSSLTKALG